MTLDIAKLKAAAEKATPGPWRLTVTRFNGITRGPFSLTKEDVLANAAEKADAEYIAAAQPGAVLELIDQNEALVAAHINLKLLADTYRQAYEEARARIAELEARERHNERQHVIDGLAAAGETWEEIQEYMKAWDAARSGINLETGGE